MFFNNLFIVFNKTINFTIIQKEIVDFNITINKSVKDILLQSTIGFRERSINFLFASTLANESVIAFFIGFNFFSVFEVVVITTAEWNFNFITIFFIVFAFTIFTEHGKSFDFLFFLILFRGIAI